MERRLRVALVVIGAIVVLGIGGFALFAFGSAYSAPKQIGYRGQMYMSAGEVTLMDIVAKVGRLHAGGERVENKPLFVSPGSPPRVIAVRLSDGHFNAYQIMR